LLQVGGSKRRAAAEAAVKSVGASMESLYFTFGEDDIMAIVDAPDAATMAAASLAINASGAVALRTTPLLTAEEIDRATQIKVDYQPPGR
jgi:uncharacterized protein with GYD domain|tara:strand:- start:64 stop:333 length:270 start_codon:yes stop_codon:yes gene_type:complete